MGRFYKRFGALAPKQPEFELPPCREYLRGCECVHCRIKRNTEKEYFKLTPEEIDNLEIIPETFFTINGKKVKMP